jgi:hypothetical protein
MPFKSLFCTRHLSRLIKTFSLILFLLCKSEIGGFSVCHGLAYIIVDFGCIAWQKRSLARSTDGISSFGWFRRLYIIIAFGLPYSVIYL